MTIIIDSTSGNVVVNGFTITSKVKPEELPGAFEVGKELSVRVLRDTLPCIFATNSVEEENLVVKIDLRFERGKLVSVFFELTDLSYQNLDAAEYYDSLKKREELYLGWLMKKLGLKPKVNIVSTSGALPVWGTTKSGGVHIFLHNKNNSWAFGNRSVWSRLKATFHSPLLRESNGDVLEKYKFIESSGSGLKD